MEKEIQCWLMEIVSLNTQKMDNHSNNYYLFSQKFKKIHRQKHKSTSSQTHFRLGVLAAIKIIQESNQQFKPTNMSSLKNVLIKVPASFVLPPSGQQLHHLQHSLVQDMFNDCFVFCWISLFINTRFFIVSGRGNWFRMRKFPQKRHQTIY